MKYPLIRLDPELLRLKEDRGYLLEVLEVKEENPFVPVPSKSGADLWKRTKEPLYWLMWDEACERAGSFPWDDLFQPFQLFTEGSGPPPVLSLNLLRRLHDGYAKLATQDHTPDSPSKATLMQEIEALLKLMHRAEDHLTNILHYVQRVIQVWVAETERLLLEENPAGVDALYRNASTLWWYMAYGIDRETLSGQKEPGERGEEEEMKDWRKRLGLVGWYSMEHGTPLSVAKSARVALLHYYDQIAPIHDEMHSLDAERWHYERLLSAALNNPPSAVANRGGWEPDSIEGTGDEKRLLEIKGAWPDERWRYYQDVIYPAGGKWKERFSYLEARCKYHEIPTPFKDYENLKRSINDHGSRLRAREVSAKKEAEAKVRKTKERLKQRKML